MTIGELAEISGMPASTLRYWERVKVLPPVHRVGGRRQYQAETKYLVAVLRLAQACGFSLPEMRRLVSGFRPEVSASERWQTTIREHKEVLAVQIAELQSMRKLLDRVQKCRCADLVECGRLASAARDRPLPKAHTAVRRRKARDLDPAPRTVKLKQR